MNLFQAAKTSDFDVVSNDSSAEYADLSFRWCIIFKCGEDGNCAKFVPENVGLHYTRKWQPENRLGCAWQANLCDGILLRLRFSGCLKVGETW